jgi:hypothetical protein
MSLISFPFGFAPPWGYGRKQSLGADPPSPSYGVVGEAAPSIYSLEGHASSCPKPQLPSISSKRQPTLPRLPAELFPAISAHQSVW